MSRRPRTARTELAEELYETVRKATDTHNDPAVWTPARQALDALLTLCKEEEGYQEAYRQLWHRDAGVDKGDS